MPSPEDLEANENINRLLPDGDLDYGFVLTTGGRITEFYASGNTSPLKVGGRRSSTWGAQDEADDPRCIHPRSGRDVTTNIAVPRRS